MMNHLLDYLIIQNSEKNENIKTQKVLKFLIDLTQNKKNTRVRESHDMPLKRGCRQTNLDVVCPEILNLIHDRNLIAAFQKLAIPKMYMTLPIKGYKPKINLANLSIIKIKF
jgi:hypothetical protein